MAKTTFMRGALILSVSGIVSKIVGAFFRIPLGNFLGADGMAYYQAVYPIYALLLTISVAGFPVAVSRMVSERIVKGDHYGANRVFKISLVIMTLLGIALFLTLWFSSDYITSTKNFADVREAFYGMRAIAPALFFVSVNSVVKGYFQGMQNMVPSAIEQVVEQMFRVIIGIALAFFLMHLGEPQAAAGATFGATAGGLAGFIFLVITYLRMVSREDFKANLTESRLKFYETRTPVKSVLYSFFAIAIPITIGSAIMPIMNNIDLLIVMERLADSGWSPDEVRSMFGQLSAMAGSIINLPQVITLAIAASLVPTIVIAVKSQDQEFLNKNIMQSVRMTVLVGMPCSIGVMALATPILLLLYPMQPEDAVASAPSLIVMGVGIIFLSLIQTLTGVLQGAGHQALPMINLAIGAVFKVIITYTLTGIPAINILGAATGTVVAYIVATLLNFISVIRYTGVKFDWKLIALKPILASIAMGAIAIGVYKILNIFLGNSLSTVGGILVAAAAYVVLIFVTKSITRDELEFFPKGTMLVKVYDKVATLFKK